MKNKGYTDKRYLSKYDNISKQNLKESKQNYKIQTEFYNDYISNLTIEYFHLLIEKEIIQFYYENFSNYEFVLNFNITNNRLTADQYSFKDVPIYIARINESNRLRFDSRYRLNLIEAAFEEINKNYKGRTISICHLELQLEFDELNYKSEYIKRQSQPYSYQINNVTIDSLTSSSNVVGVSSSSPITAFIDNNLNGIKITGLFAIVGRIEPCR